MRVEVRPYDERWPRSFRLIERQLTLALAGVDVAAIEHVGSTSVPGLAAKPIIDIDVIVSNHHDVEQATQRLASIGYEPVGDLGVAERYAFTAPPDGPRRHVYVIIDGCLSLRNHLAVRGVLRSDPQLRRRYGELKLRLAANDYDDVGGYVADKSELLQEILAQGGIGADERRLIADANSC